MSQAIVLSNGAVARRGGRKPVRESRADEHRERITAWKLTPPKKREPPTLTALARELGIAKSTAHYYASRAPDCVAELIDEAESKELQRYPGVLNTLFNLAEEGNVDAIKTVIRGIVEPRRPPPKAFRFEDDARLQIAVAQVEQWRREKRDAAVAVVRVQREECIEAIAVAPAAPQPDNDAETIES